MVSVFEIENPRKSAVEIVVDKIKTLLIEKKLKPGDLIPSETVLAENLKTSRGSIREAMKILSAYGIVEIRRGTGTYISTAKNPQLFDPLLFKILVSDYDHRQLREIRNIMEEGVINLVIANGTAEDLARLEAVMEKMEELKRGGTDDTARWNELDIAYHRLLGEIAHNDIVSNIYGFIIDMFAPTINAREGFEAHRNLHRAIMKRRKEEVLSRLQEHTETWDRVYRDLPS